jgi:hypothetical protein
MYLFGFMFSEVDFRNDSLPSETRIPSEVSAQAGDVFDFRNSRHVRFPVPLRMNVAALSAPCRYPKTSRYPL